MLVGEEKETCRDDGSVFLTRQVCIPGAITHLNVLVVNEQIQQKATALYPFAKAMSESKRSRFIFMQTSRESFNIHGGPIYARAKTESIQAAQRVAHLELLASGESVGCKLVVTLGDWICLLDFFAQELSVGAVRTIGG